MKTFVSILLIIISLPAFSTLNEFEKANLMYKNGNYSEAYKLYTDIINKNYESPDLFFNLGNTCYRLNKVGESIYFYEKALSSDPQNEDYSYNLELAKLRVKNIPEVIPESALYSFFKKIIYSTSYKFKAYFNLIIFVFTLIIFIFFIKARKSRNKKLYFISVIFLTAVVITGIILMQIQISEQTDHQKAIVITNEVQTKSSPNEEANDLFPVYEGFKAKIENISGDWCEIKLTDGKKAWIKENNLKRF